MYVLLIHSAVEDLMPTERSSGLTLSMNAFASAAVGAGAGPVAAGGVCGAAAQAQRIRKVARGFMGPAPHLKTGFLGSRPKPPTSRRGTRSAPRRGGRGAA